MSVDQDIETALFGHVRDLDLGGAAIAWPNVAFKPDPLLAYVEVRHLRNTNSRFLVKGSAPHLRQGILQLTVKAPLRDGVDQAMTLAGSIADQCPADLLLWGDAKVRVQSAPDVATPEKSDVSWEIRVDVRYECLA